MPFVSDGFAKQDPNGSANLTASGVVDLFTGTPDGTKFLRDDGTLASAGAGAEQAVGPSDSPQFAGINLGHASDTTITRVSAGVVAVEGVTLQSLLSSTNKLGLAAGGSNADLSATGGPTHFLRQASAGAAVTVGAIVDGDLPAGSNAATVALKAPLASPTFTGAVTSPSTIQTGALQFSGTQTSAGADISNIYRAAGGSLVNNCPGGALIYFGVANSNKVSIGATGLTIEATTNPGDYGIGRSAAGMLQLRGPTNNGVDILAGSATVQANLSNYGLLFATNHSYPGGSAVGPRRPYTGDLLCAASTSGAAYIGGDSGAIFYGYGGTHSTLPGSAVLTPKAISLANAAQRNIQGSATGRSGFVEIVDLTNHRVARYSINAGVPTKDSGHAQFVAGAPGAGEVGVELSSTTLRVNNNSGGALLIAINVMLAY